MKPSGLRVIQASLQVSRIHPIVTRLARPRAYSVHIAMEKTVMATDEWPCTSACWRSEDTMRRMTYRGVAGVATRAAAVVVTGRGNDVTRR